MGEKMDVKPVTLAIHEVADGKMSVAASDGAEIPFPEPEGQLDLLGAEDALIIQDLGDGLQALPLAVLPHGEDEALAGPVPFAEGDGDPHPGTDLCSGGGS